MLFRTFPSVSTLSKGTSFFHNTRININIYLTWIHTNTHEWEKIFLNTNCRELPINYPKINLWKIRGSFMIIRVEKIIIYVYSCLFMTIHVEKKEKHEYTWIHTNTKKYYLWLFVDIHDNSCWKEHVIILTKFIRDFSPFWRTKTSADRGPAGQNVVLSGQRWYMMVSKMVCEPLICVKRHCNMPHIAAQFAIYWSPICRRLGTTH